MLKLPKMGREVLVLLFPEPKPELDEGEAPEAYAERVADWTSKQDVKLRVKLVNRPTYRRWAYEYDRINATAKARRREARAQFTAEDNPKLHDDSIVFLTEDSARDLDDLMKRAISESTTEILGLQVDDLDDAAYKDPLKITEILEHAGYLPRAFNRVLQAQNPDRKEAFC